MINNKGYIICEAHLKKTAHLILFEPLNYVNYAVNYMIVIIKLCKTCNQVEDRIHQTM